MPVNKIVPSWVYPGAKFDLDFANQRYWGGNVALCANSNAAVAMQSLINGPNNNKVQYAPDIYGNLLSFIANVPRITPGLGLWCEENYTNYALWCRDQTNAAWTKLTMTAAKDQPSADIPATANTASSLTASSALGTSLQSITQASTTFIFSAYVKRLTGSGTVGISVDGTTWTDITALINSNTYTLVQTPVQTLANPIVGFRISTNGDAIAVDFCQCENSAIGATSPLITTTASLARGVEEPAISDPGGTFPGNARSIIKNIFVTGSPHSILTIHSGNGRVGNTTAFVSDDNTAITEVANGGTTKSPGGVGRFTTNNAVQVNTANNGNYGLPLINKICGRASGAGSAVCMNGGTVATGAGNMTPISSTMTHCGIMNNGSGGISLNGYTSRLVFWAKELTNSEMQEFTR